MTSGVLQARRCRPVGPTRRPRVDRVSASPARRRTASFGTGRPKHPPAAVAAGVPCQNRVDSFSRRCLVDYPGSRFLGGQPIVSLSHVSFIMGLRLFPSRSKAFFLSTDIWLSDQGRLRAGGLEAAPARHCRSRSRRLPRFSDRRGGGHPRRSTGFFGAGLPVDPASR